MLAMIMLAISFTRFKKPRLDYTYIPSKGRRTVAEILDGSPQTVINFTRMSLPTFCALAAWLEKNTKLEASRFTAIDEKLCIFLNIAAQGSTMRKTAFDFGHSTETIFRLVKLNLKSRWELTEQHNSVFHEVVDALLTLAKHKIRLPSCEKVPEKIQDNPKFFPFFQNCIGAIDGSHFAVKPPYDEQAAWRNRKQMITQNVLAVCDFEGRILYLLCGWEGSAHDGRLLRDALEKKDFHIPRGFYYLGDAGFGGFQRVLIPYRGVRYHLQETARTGLRPSTPEELFNLRHSQLRTDIERVLGGLKRKFRIHTCSAEFSPAIHAKIVYATAGLWNWMLDCKEISMQELSKEALELDPDQHINDLTEEEEEGVGNENMTLQRSILAREMWMQYQHTLQA